MVHSPEERQRILYPDDVPTVRAPTRPRARPVPPAARSAAPRPSGPSPSGIEYRITIAADDGGKSSESSSGKGLGHAWVVLEKVSNGKVVEVTTRGLWKDGYAKRNGPGFDIRQNMEVGRRPAASKTATIDEATYQKLWKKADENVTYSELSDNCTDFAVRMWGAATGEKLSGSSYWTLGVSTPANLVTAINASKKKPK